MIRAKFKVLSKTITGNGVTVKLTPVTATNEENSKFFKWTPTGSIEMGLVSTETAELLEIEKEYFVDFTRAE